MCCLRVWERLRVHEGPDGFGDRTIPRGLFHVSLGSVVGPYHGNVETWVKESRSGLLCSWEGGGVVLVYRVVKGHSENGVYH